MTNREKIASLRAVITTLETLITELEAEERELAKAEADLSEDEELVEGTPEQIAAAFRVQYNSVAVGYSRVMLGDTSSFKVLKGSILPDKISDSITNKTVHEIYQILKRFADENNMLKQNVEINATASALCTSLIGTSNQNGKKLLAKILK